MSTRRMRALLYAGAVLLLAIITWVDYATGYELGFFIFYFVPVALTAWYGSRKAGIAFAFASGLCWYISDRISHHPYSNALLIYWETFMRLVSFLTTALTLSHIRNDLRQREDLLHVVSHDLRAPLGALVGQAAMLRKRSDRDAFAKARVEAILRCASRMDAMIEDLLDAARTESHQLRLEVGPVDVGTYLSELLDRSASLLEVDRVRLVLDGAGGLVARADPNRLDRIVLNLLTNALKYSPTESPVELGAAAAGGWVTISVADHGPGIPDEDLPHVFDRFYRGERTAARGGLGIGLYSVRLLVEAHGGTVRAEPGRHGGTTFRVALPASAGSEAAPSAG
ncbi:MAG TPA: HAMP domain-containing sensor histidine kinase [Anaeromyxobacter sp.]